MNREEKIKGVIEKGYTYNKETGKIISPRGKPLIGKDSKGYNVFNITINKERVFIKAHQFAWYVVYNEIVEVLDHINQDKYDNRICNLRSVNKQQNQHNKNIGKGYSWFNKRNRWGARIRLDGKLIHLGYFIKEEDARQAYLDAKKIYHKS